MPEHPQLYGKHLRRTAVPLPGMLSVPENRLQNVGKK
jgi:hypothetical protein